MASTRLIVSIVGSVVLLLITGIGLALFFTLGEDSIEYDINQHELQFEERDSNTTDFARTIIFLHKSKFLDSKVFIRGGLEHEDCTGEPAESDECSIPISISPLGYTPNYDSYNDWMQGDDFLDWFGEEDGQNYHLGEPASGTNLAWTTDDPSVDGYQDLNEFGEDYWMIDLEMDCSRTDDTWFSVKGYLADADVFTGWEMDINQGICSGDAGGSPTPFKSTNHMGRCGYMNVFSWNDASCIIQEIPEIMTTTEEYTTMPPDYDRTVILFHKAQLAEELVFIRGGLDLDDCGGAPAETDNCSLPFIINEIGDTPIYSGYNDWMVGDNFLDWWGEESSQGYHEGIPASGSALAKTTNDPEALDGFQEINIYGEDYWMIDFDMDCSLTIDGWFSFKGWLANADIYTGWEQDINQGICTGEAGLPTPYSSNNHMGRCGYLNVFGWNQGACIIEPLPETDTTYDRYTTDSETSDSWTTDTDMETTDLTTPSINTKTVIFFHKKVYDDFQYVFIRGGLNEDYNPSCNGPPLETDPCSLPITVDSLGDTANYERYNAWREGDTHFDWFGPEPGQGYHNTDPASGTPMAWTTNRMGVDGYQELNHYGDDYWMVQMDLDCSLTNDGWFEMKGWLAFAEGYTGWELDVQQGFCTGDGSSQPPTSSNNHLVKCGFVNVFEWNEGSCIIEPFV